MEQAAIAALGATTVYLSQDHRPHLRKCACLFGLVAQPFWFYAAFTAQQWGIFGLTVIYTVGWARGFWTFWIRGKSA